MQKKFRYIIPLIAVTVLPTLAEAAAPRTYNELARLLVGILDSATGLLIGAGLAAYFWQLSINLKKVSQGGMKDLAPYLTWGILVFFVMVSIWGILQLLQNSLFGTG